MSPSGQAIVQFTGSRNWRQALVDYSAWIIVAVLIVIGTVVTPLFLTVRNLLDVLQQSAIIGVMATGQFLVILTGGIDLSVGSILALSAVVGALCMSHGYGAAFGVVASVAACGCLGVVSGLIVSKGRLPPFIVTFGMMAMARGMALTFSGGRPVSLAVSTFDGVFSKIGSGVWPETIWAVVIVVIYALLARFPLGRHIYATGGNPEGARLSGVNTDAMLVLVYGISGVCAAIGGLIFLARSTVAMPTSGNGYELQTIAGAVLGGTDLFGGSGRLSGVVIGVIVLTMLTNILDLVGVNPFWNFFAVGTALWLAVIFRSRMARRG